MPLIIDPQKSYRHPAVRELALACTVYGALAILAAKIRIILNNTNQIANFFENNQICQLNQEKTHKCDKVNL